MYNYIRMSYIRTYNQLGFAFMGIGGIWTAAGHPGVGALHFVTAMAFFTVVLVMTRPSVARRNLKQRLLELGIK